MLLMSSSEGNFDWTHTVAERKIQEAMDAVSSTTCPARGSRSTWKSTRSSRPICAP
jgi:hypothetical protein